jgi:hypothetical protein
MEELTDKIKVIVGGSSPLWQLAQNSFDRASAGPEAASLQAAL